MRIGELAAVTGTTTKTLRFYEDSGLLRLKGAPPPDTASTARTRLPGWTSSAAAAPPG